MRVAVAVLAFAVVCLTASSVAWLRTTSTAPTALRGVDTSSLLAELERSHRPSADIAIGARYAGRLDLLDPRLALPVWHEHPRDEAVAVHRATKACPPAPIVPISDASLAKAYAWHAQTCSAGTNAPPESLVDGPPFLHPSGRSYAALAVAGGANAPAWIRAHGRAFHVLELAALDPAALDPEDRALAALPTPAWEALSRGDRFVLTPSMLVVADHAAIGLSRVRIHPRATWEAFARDRSLALVPRASGALCARPESSALCWEALSPGDRHRGTLVFGTAASAGLVAFSSLFLGVAYVGERRRAHRDRVHVLRTLTHELRTPATTLRLDIEPLRAAYDQLPASCQEPLLRISDGIERLNRVLHRSARYMALFETAGAPPERLVKPHAIESAKVMFEELQDEWPDGVSLTATSADGPVRTDPEWLGVAVRNLVENAARHGKGPIAVTWSLGKGTLSIRVGDAGNSPSFSLRRAITPFERDAKSTGLGLGLAIVDRVARLLGGRLSHEPTPTVFELRLPVKEGAS